MTSAAAERAARTLADGTGFQRWAVGLQYINPLLWTAGVVNRFRATGPSSLTYTLRHEPSTLVVMRAAPSCARRYGVEVVKERKVASTGLAIRAICRRFRIAGFGACARTSKYPRLPTRNLPQQPLPECNNHRPPVE